MASKGRLPFERPVLLVAQRELRQGKRTFLLSIVTILLATAMLSSVLGLGDALRSTLQRDARTILGGHYEIRLNSRDFSDEEVAWLTDNSSRTNRLTSVRAAAFTDDLTALIQIRATDDAYPLFGELGLAGEAPFAHDMLAGSFDGVIPVVVSSDLGGAMEVGIGDRFSIGAATVEVKALADAIPDPSSTMLLNAPLVYMARENLAATGLDQIGTLKSERIRVDVGERDRTQWRESLKERFPDNDWRVRGTDRVVPGLQDSIGRMETLMLLVSLGTMLIAGLCIGNTVSTYLRSRISSIAVLKSLGMSAGKIRASYLLVTMLFAAVGTVLGIPLGYVGQTMIVDALSARLPFEIVSTVSLRTLAVVPLIALLTTWIFATRPLHVFCAISPTSLFSLSSGHAPQLEKSSAAIWKSTLVPSAALVALLALVAGDQLFLIYFGLGGVAAAVFFRLLADGMIKIAAVSRPKSVSTKIAFRLVARSGGQVGAAASSLGVGLTALLTFSLTEANFNNQLTAILANKTPEYYLAGVQPGDAERIREAGAEWLPTPEALVTMPTLRARITHLNSVPVEELDPPEDIDWIIHGDRYITWATDQTTEWTGASRVSEGPEWTSDNDELLVSFDAEAAEGFGLEIGDPVDVTILNENYRLKIANLRRIDWTTFDVNFVMVLSDGPWSANPHSYLGSVRDLRGDHDKFQRAVVKAAPSVTPIRTKTIVESVTNLLSKIGDLLKIVTLTATFSGILVLGAAIAEGRHRRAHDSVVLRILGTSRGTLVSVFRIEFVVIALLAALPALCVSIAAGYSITHWVLNIPWSVDWGNAALVMLGTTMTVLALGEASNAQLVRTPPLLLLRNE